MSCNDLLTFQKLINKKFQNYEPHLNPFCSILCSEKWEWPQMPLQFVTSNKTKNGLQKASLRSQILSWFETQSYEDKCVSTLINNPSFLEAFLQIYHKWNSKMIYNIYQEKSLRNYLLNQHEKQPFAKIISKLRIAWLEQPILYFNCEEEASQTFFYDLISWMDSISGGKVFEYAHKIKNKADPEENILWFNHKTYQQLQSWLVNEFQKSIIKCFYNHSTLNRSHLERVQRIKMTVKNLKTERKNGEGKNKDDIGEFISMKVNDTKKISCEQKQAFQIKLKVYEDQYYEEVALLIEHEQRVDEKKLKKKKSKKRKNKKRNDSIVKQNEEQEIVKDSKKQSIPQSQQQERVLSQKQVNDEKKEEEDDIQIYEEKKNEDNCSCEKKLEATDNEKIKQFKGNYQDNHSGYSQPELGCKSSSLKASSIKRPLSPDNKVTNEKTTTKITLDEELSFLEGYENQRGSSVTFPSKEGISDTCIQGDRKKKKKKSNKNNIVKELGKKLGKMLISRQLNSFLDSLSIQTNNLCNHKMVCFERVRFFVRCLFPSADTILFGSNAVGLSLPTSDIDIMLYNLPCFTKEQASEVLAHLTIQINAMGWIVSCENYLNAKVPLLKLEIDPTINYFSMKRKCDFFGTMGMGIDPMTLSHLELNSKKDKIGSKSIKVDLTVNLNDSFGSHSTELMKHWMAEFPQLHRIVLAFKYILAKKGFNSNWKGGIGSYCLFIMIAAFLKENPEILQEDDEGEIFLKVLKFYGQEFQNHLKSITIREGPCFLTLDQTMEILNSDKGLDKDIMNNLLRIIDPISHRIMSGNCSLYNTIKTQFRRIYQEVIEAKQALNRQVQLGYNNTEAGKLLENKKSMQKWLNKYQIRSGFLIKEVFNGGF